VLLTVTGDKLVVLAAASGAVYQARKFTIQNREATPQQIFEYMQSIGRPIKLNVAKGVRYDTAETLKALSEVGLDHPEPKPPQALTIAEMKRAVANKYQVDPASIEIYIRI
jgi:hypothetical protein